MSLPQEFWAGLSKKEDEELYDILAHPDDYDPEALQAVREELQRRKLPPERETQLRAVVEQRRADEQAKADQPLGLPLRVVMFFLSGTVCVGAVGLAILPSYYQSRGYTKKASQCTAAFGWGLCLWLGLALLTFLGDHLFR